MEDVVTLLEILVKELPKWGGWPEGINEVEQDDGGGIVEMNSGYCSDFQFDLAEDWKIAIVTRDQYEAALSASNNPEWNGEGLPPVGCVVEVRAEDFEGGWITIKVVHVHNEEIVGVVQSESEHLNDRLEKFSRNYNRAEFRPIRSEADRKRDEAVEALTKYTLRGDASDIYQAISAGKIPGIRIE